MSLTTERQELRETLKELLKDDFNQTLTEGEKKGKCHTAKQMKADGMPIATICKYTGLSKKEVEKL